MMMNDAISALLLIGMAISPVSANPEPRTESAGSGSGRVNYTDEAMLFSTTNDLKIRANGSILLRPDLETLKWTLSDKSPDADSLRAFNFADGAEICLKSDKAKACHTLGPNVVGVWVGQYEGKSHLIHLTI